MDTLLLVVNLLADHGWNVYAQLPENVSRPVVRVEEAGGFAEGSDGPWHVQKPDFQVDVWGLTKPATRTLAHDIKSFLVRTPRYNPSTMDGNIVGVRVTEPAWSPDPDWPANGQPGPRYLMVVSIAAHQ